MERGYLKHHGPTLELQYHHGEFRLNALNARVQGWKPEDQLLLLWIGEDLIRVPAQYPPDTRHMRLLISPLEIAISRSPVTNSSILNVLRCRLASLEKLENGKVVLVLQGAGWKLQAIITQASTRRLELEPGIELYALIKSVVVDHARR
jgi:molybdate transport system ATP-binding protein